MKTPTTTYTTAANVRLAMIESCSLSFDDPNVVLPPIDFEAIDQLAVFISRGTLPKDPGSAQSLLQQLAEYRHRKP